MPSASALDSQRILTRLETSPCAASSGKLESADTWAGEARDNNFIAWRLPNYHGSEQPKDAEKEEHKI